MRNKKIIISSFVFASILYLIFCILYAAPVAHAFEATSATFELHAGAIGSTAGAATSTSFQIRSAGGQTAIGTSASTTSSIASGILYWLLGWFTAYYEQEHYRWREDTAGCTESSTSASCWVVAEDTQYNPFPKDTVKRLRFEVANKGWTRSGSPVFTLEVAELSTPTGDCGTGPFASGYTAIPTVVGSKWIMATSTNVNDGDITTNVGTVPATGLTDGNRTFVAGQIKTTGNTTASITLNSSSFTEIEYGVSATSLATNGAMYCFRLTNAGSTANFGYAQYAKAQLQSGLPPTGMLDSAVFDTFSSSGTGQGAAYNSIMWTGSTEGTGKVRFQFATSDSSSGPWTFYGSSNNGGTCDTNSYYDTSSSAFGGGPGKPVEISCAGAYHNNQRYFRYRIQICSALDCSSSGLLSPVVNNVVVNWAP